MAAAAFLSFIQQLKSLPPEPEYEPNVDERDEKEERKLRESDDLSKGAVLKGLVQKGRDEPFPVEGDVVVLRYSIGEQVGPPVPQPLHLAVLGKGERRLPRGWELALYEMRPGERTALEVWPEYGFAHRDCGMKAPPHVQTDKPLYTDLELLAVWRKAVGAKALGEAQDMFKYVHTESEMWESPREPYEVTAEVAVRSVSDDGIPGRKRAHGTATMNFAVGSPHVPQALQTCICSMSKNERSSFWVPSALLQGVVSKQDAERLPPLPSGAATVELDITLFTIVQVRDLHGNGIMLKRRLREGDGNFPMDCPLDDSRVRVHYRVLSHDGNVCYHDSRTAGSGMPLEFDTGMGAAPEAVDVCSRLMLPNEMATVTSDWQHAYKGRDDVPQGVPFNADLSFEIELLGFDKDPAWVQSDVEEKLRQAVALKDQGNALYKQSAWNHAQQKYMKALRVLTAAGHEVESREQVEEVSKQKVACMLNLAQLSSKQEEHGEAITWATKAIREDSETPKAYFRRAVSHGWLGHYDQAMEDLDMVLQLDPSLEVDVKRELKRLQLRHEAGDAKQRAEMANFFDRQKPGKTGV